jgi:tight adherence protein B
MALRPHEWLVVRISTVVGLAVVLVLLTGWVIRGILLGALLGWLGTALYLRWRQRRRTRAFGDSLADTLQLVASSLQTGFSLSQALDAAQQSGAQPMSGELGRALAAARIGSVLEDELDQVGVRMDSEDWRWAVMAMRIQHHVGGNLAEVLLTTVKTLRERAAMRRQARALSAEGRLSAYILIGLPIALFAFFLLVRREYVEKLWTTPLGLLMSLGAVVLMGLGTFWMSRVVKVEV